MIDALAQLAHGLIILLLLWAAGNFAQHYHDLQAIVCLLCGFAVLVSYVVHDRYLWKDR